VAFCLVGTFVTCQLAVVEVVPSSVPRQSFPFGDVTHLFIRPCADTTDMLRAGEGRKTGGGEGTGGTNLLPWRSWLVARR